MVNIRNVRLWSENCAPTASLFLLLISFRRLPLWLYNPRFLWWLFSCICGHNTVLSVQTSRSLIIFLRFLFLVFIYITLRCFTLLLVWLVKLDWHVLQLDFSWHVQLHLWIRLFAICYSSSVHLWLSQWFGLLFLLSLDKHVELSTINESSSNLF